MDVADGFFTAYLGDDATAPLDVDIFAAHSALFLGMRVTPDTDFALPLLQMATVPYAGFANACGDAATLEGKLSSDFAGASHSHAWGDLSGVPAGLGDGDDDTTYTAGTGLGLAGGAFSVDSAYVQRRVSATCAAGSSIRAIAANGSVTCEPDDAGSGGITQITAGSGLTGGGSSATVSVSVATSGINATHLATNSVAAAEIAAGAVGSSELATNAVQIANIHPTARIYTGEFDCSSGTGATTTSPSIMETLRVTTPVAGRLTVMVDITWWTDCDATSTTSVQCTGGYIGLCTSGASSTTCGGTWAQSRYEDPDNASGLNTYKHRTIVRTLNVGAGTTTLYVNGAATNSAGGTGAVNPSDCHATAILAPGGGALTITN